MRLKSKSLNLEKETEILKVKLKELESNDPSNLSNVIYSLRFQDMGSMKVSFDEKIFELFKSNSNPLVLQEAIQYFIDRNIKKITDESIEMIAIEMLKNNNLELGVKYSLIEYLGCIRSKKSSVLLKKELTEQNKKVLPKLYQMVEWSLNQIDSKVIKYIN